MCILVEVLSNQESQGEPEERKSIDAPIKIREAQTEDLPELLDIYNYTVRTSTATFQLEPLTLEERQPWFASHRGRYPLLVAEAESGTVAGYCCISPFRHSGGYAGTVENSIYVHKDFRRKGIAFMLMKEIIARAKELGYHAIIACIAGSNEPSIRLHEQLGFEFSGRLKQVGFKFSRWEDDVFYQLIL